MLVLGTMYSLFQAKEELNDVDLTERPTEAFLTADKCMASVLIAFYAYVAITKRSEFLKMFKVFNDRLILGISRNKQLAVRAILVNKNH